MFIIHIQKLSSQRFTIMLNAIQIQKLLILGAKERTVYETKPLSSTILLEDLHGKKK